MSKYNTEFRLKLLLVAKNGLTGKRLEEMTGIKSIKWRQWLSGRGLSVDMVEAVAKLWPEHAFWLLTGLTFEETGHSAPYRVNASFPFDNGSSSADAAHEYFVECVKQLNSLVSKLMEAFAEKYKDDAKPGQFLEYLHIIEGIDLINCQVDLLGQKEKDQAVKHLLRLDKQYLRSLLEALYRFNNIKAIVERIEDDEREYVESLSKLDTNVNVKKEDLELIENYNKINAKQSERDAIELQTIRTIVHNLASKKK